MSGNWTSPTPKGSGGSSQPQGPPYASKMAIVGGVPSPSVDDPVAVVLLVLFLLSAAAHMAILKINKRRGLKFVFSGMLFALCVLRGVSLAARVVWASYPDTVNAVIAASVMTQCGSVLIFIINLFFAQRVLRAYHPRLGWHHGATGIVWLLVACVLCCLIMAIVATIHSFFTLSKSARAADRAVQLFAGVYLACLAFLPVPVVVLAVVTRPRRFHVEKFGAGRWRAKVGLLIFTSLVATLGAGFRVGVNFDGRPGSDPAWFHSRACYYCFNFVTDLVVSTAYLLARFDRRFIVPDGARGPGDYSPISPVMPSGSATNSNTNLMGKLPLMGSEKPLVMMRQGSFSGHTIVTPFRPFTPTSSPPQSRVMTPSTTPPPQSCNGNTNTNATTCCYNTDTSNTAVHNSPTASGSLHRFKLPPYQDYLTHHDDMPPQSKPTRSKSQTRTRPLPPSLNLEPLSKTKTAAINRTNSSKRNSATRRLIAGGRSGRSVMRSVRMRINSEADAYGPDGSSSSGHATDTDPLVASTNTPAAPTTTPAKPNTSSTPNNRQRYQRNRHHHFLGRTLSRVNGAAASNTDVSVRAPAQAHLGPPILPDLDLDLELLSATLLAPWALDSWGFTAAGRRASSRRSDGGGNSNSRSRSSTATTTSSRNIIDGGVGDELFMMSGGSGESGGGSGPSNQSSSSSSEINDGSVGGSSSSSERSRSQSRSGESSCTYTQSGRARTM